MTAGPRHHIMTYCGLTDNQYNLVIIFLFAFLVQVIAIYYLKPEKFDCRLFGIALVFAVLYNVTFFKLFSD